MPKTLRLYNIALSSAVLVISLSTLILATWHFDLTSVKNAFPEQHISNPVTALCFLCSGVSLLFLVSEKEKMPRFALSLGAVVFLLGTTVFSSIVFNFETSVDKWLYADKLILYGSRDKPNHMAPNTALCFSFLGLSLVLFGYRSSPRKYYADFSALLCTLIAVVSLVGYLYHADEFYNFHSHIPIAFPTALSFFLLSVAILCYRSRFGLFKVFTAPYAGSTVARTLIPLSVVVPVTIGALKMKGEEAGWFSGSLGTALAATTNMAIFIFLIWRSSITLNRAHKALFYEIKERTRLHEEVEELNQHLEQRVNEKSKKLADLAVHHQKQLLQASLGGQEKERKQIGMELHDNVNQLLATIGLYLDVGLHSPELKDEMIKKSKAQIDEVIEEIRRLSKSLVSYRIEEGDLKEGLREMISPAELSGNLRFELCIVEEAALSLNFDQTLAVYRMVQEQVNNILKYAGASVVWIVLEKTDDEIQLLVRDNGRGFDPERKRAGIGLSNIESRAELLGGEMAIYSEEGKGCELKVTFPRDAVAA